MTGANQLRLASKEVFDLVFVAAAHFQRGTAAQGQMELAIDM